MEPSLSQVIVGVAIALIVSVVLFGLNVKSSLVRIETILTGADGTNGLNGDVKALRKRTHDHGDSIHAAHAKIEQHEIRLAALDRRFGPDDRRSPA